MIDSHAHLDDERFRDDLEAVLGRAREAGVTRILSVGTGLPSCERTVKLAEEQPHLVSAVVGIDPHQAGEATPDAMEYLRELAQAPNVVGLGETGLEYFHNTAPREVQVGAFEAHVRLALDVDLPLVIHCRDAFPDCLRILRAHRQPELRGVAHCFTGGQEEAEAFVELGFCISFSGIVTFPKSGDLRTVAAALPSDRLLIETDCPWLAPQPVRGKRNEPAFLTHVAETMASVRGESLEETAEMTARNAAALFGIM